MSSNKTGHELVLTKILSTRTIFRLLVAWGIVGLFALFGSSWLGDSLSGTGAIVFFAILLFTIVFAAFGVVHEADQLAYKLGEPYGTLVLTLSIVAIEVILISAVMLGPSETATIGKDSIFSVMMIIMNLVIGLCILLGGLKYGEQEYNAQGAMSYLGMIILLGGIGLMLPNYIQGAGDGIFSDIQAMVLSALIVLLYGFFLFLQMKGYRHLYVQPSPGMMEIPFSQRNIADKQTSSQAKSKKVGIEIWIRSTILIITVLPIVLLSHDMAIVVDYGIAAANLPPVLGGVLIAIIVFTPESLTAVKAALNNESQRAVNLCHGAFVSTVGLTIPSVLIIGLITGKTVMFGLTPTETILFVITLLLSLMSYLGKRTTPMVGIMHLVLFAVFILLIFYP